MSESGTVARLRVGVADGRQRISPLLFGKFCEHLGRNIYHGMEAQILRNCTFANWQFWGGECPIDGGILGQCDQQKVMEQIQRHSEREGFDADLAKASYEETLTYGWLRLGESTNVRYSPDVAPAGARAQRIEVLADGQPTGCWQPIWLPLHRTRKYRYRMIARAVSQADLRLVISNEQGKELCIANCHLGDAWSVSQGELELPEGLAADARYRFAISSTKACNIVIARVMLYPSDAVEGKFDPEIINLLRDAKLPLLRWPGGNFVSGYHWRAGIGPMDLRPTRPNPAWEGLEYNLFGTIEFIGYCRAVGCEPMICVNAGNGTAQEAADWVEYCNGALDTPMGSLRAEHGHSEPFGVKYWEVGNELWGKWQVGHTTPAGNADRFRAFAAAMRKVDSSIELIATGPQCKMDQEWTHVLLAEGGPELKTITDHILAWTEVTPADDPWDVFQGYMAHAVDAAKQYCWLREQMRKAGIAEPAVALTEMQVFPSWKDADSGTMTREQLIRPNTMAEAVHFVTWLCECVRLGGFVTMITHSAVVNHGGGLSKQRERSWGHPVHHAHVMGVPLHGAAVLPVRIECATYSTKRSYGYAVKMENVPELDAVAGLTPAGQTVVLLVSRAREAVQVQVRFDGVEQAEVQVDMLHGDMPWAHNSLEQMDKVAVKRCPSVRISSGQVTMEVPAGSVIRFTVAR